MTPKERCGGRSAGRDRPRRALVVRGQSRRHARRIPQWTALHVVGGNGKGDREVRRLVAISAPAWRPDAFELAFSTVDGASSSSTPRLRRTVWRTVPGEIQAARLVRGRRAAARLGRPVPAGARSEQAQLFSLRLPVGPSGVVFVRESHRFVMVRYSPATGRSDLVLLQAEVDPGRRFLYSAPGEFGSLAMSPNGRWLLVGWVNADQWLFLRLTAAKVQAVSNISRQFGVETAGKPIAKPFRQASAGAVPHPPDPRRCGRRPGRRPRSRARTSRSSGGLALTRVPWDGRLVRGVQLPAEGVVTYFTWDPVRKRSPNRPWRRWGSDRLLRLLFRVLDEYAAAHPEAEPRRDR